MVAAKHTEVKVEKMHLQKDKAKFAKAKDRKQTSGNIKVSMMGGGAKETRQKLRSAVFKDVKDRIGKKKYRYQEWYR